MFIKLENLYKKGDKPMKRKALKNKIYKLIGQAVVFIAMCSSLSIFMLWAINQRTVYI